MKVKYLLAVILAGLTAFVWSSISWMVIPWHQPTMNGFENESAVGLAIKTAAPEPGIYTYPAWTDDVEDMERKHQEGPYVFASVVPVGVGSEMGSMMLGGFLVNVLGALLLLILMLQVPDPGWKLRLQVGLIAALFISAIPALMNWNWWHFPVGFTAVGIADGFIGWSLASLVMAKMIATRKTLAG